MYSLDDGQLVQQFDFFQSALCYLADVLTSFTVKIVLQVNDEMKSTQLSRNNVVGIISGN